jgi:hypothetical protein
MRELVIGIGHIHTLEGLSRNAIMYSSLIHKP